MQLAIASFFACLLAFGFGAFHFFAEIDVDTKYFFAVFFSFMSFHFLLMSVLALSDFKKLRHAKS